MVLGGEFQLLFYRQCPADSLGMEFLVCRIECGKLDDSPILVVIVVLIFCEVCGIMLSLGVDSWR